MCRDSGPGRSPAADLRDEKLKVHFCRGARKNNAEKRENEKWPYHSYQWLFFYVRGALRKGKRKQASQDRNGYLRRGLLGKRPRHAAAQNTATGRAGCAAARLKMDKLDMTNGRPESPRVLPRCWPSLQHSSVSPSAPLPSEGGNPSPRLGYKTQAALFKTGCLSEASFPSNKQSAKT